MATRTSRSSSARAAARRRAAAAAAATPPTPAPAPTPAPQPASQPTRSNRGAAIGIVIGILAILAFCAGLLWVGAQITDPANFSAEAKATIAVGNAKATATTFARATQNAELATKAAEEASAILGAPTNTPTNTPTAAPTPTQAPTSTPVPPTATRVPPTSAPTATITTTIAISPSTGIVSLKYDETNGTALTPGQSRLIALYLREAGAGPSQAEMEKAVAAIQLEAKNAGATVFQGSTLKLDQHHAWLVWTPNALNSEQPNDVSKVYSSLPLVAIPPTLGRVYIQVPFAEGVPLRTKDTWSGAEYWAVAVH